MLVAYMVVLMTHGLTNIKLLKSFYEMADIVGDNEQLIFGSTMALGLTQPLTEMSTRNISWEVKAAGA